MNQQKRVKTMPTSHRGQALRRAYIPSARAVEKGLVRFPSGTVYKIVNGTYVRLADKPKGTPS